MDRVRRRRRRLARKAFRFTVLNLMTAAVMIPLAITILNEVTKSRGVTAVGSEYLFIAILWYGAYRLIEWVLR